MFLSTLKLPPSIFNDVIGPVMRGPSSSHCAAALRIGRMALDLMKGRISEVLVEFHPEGSLATTHESQGSDMGLFGGLLGWEATDPRLVESGEALAEAGISAKIRITDFAAPHPNTYRMTLSGPQGRHRMTAISTGGGMVEVVEVDGLPVGMAGDAHETLIWVEPGMGAGLLETEGVRELENRAESVAVFQGTGEPWDKPVELLKVRSLEPLPEDALEGLRNMEGVREVRALAPVLPVLSGEKMQVPFLTCRELLEFNQDRELALWELAAEYESARGSLLREEVVSRMEEIVEILEASVGEGLAGTEYGDRILGSQAPLFAKKMDAGGLWDSGILNQIVLRVTALMEVKSAMGVIVAAPTAGSCGAVPGACLGAGAAMGLTRREVAGGMLAAGMIGVLIAARSTFAAEVCGCQAECGSGSGMAAAALVTLAGGTTDQALAAASMALQNTLGMICDPVANRVEVPCLGKNVMAAANALSCANMALAGFDPVIPLDEVIHTMDEVGKSLPRELRCTALGGLSVTPTSKRLTKRLGENP